MRPWLLRPACVGSDSTSVFSGSSVVISSKPEIAMKRRPGLVGLNFLIGMVFLYTLPKRPSIFWPSPSVTMAFFQADVCPTEPLRRGLRLVLPRRATVLTSLTLWRCSREASAGRSAPRPAEVFLDQLQAVLRQQ